MADTIAVSLVGHSALIGEVAKEGRDAGRISQPVSATGVTRSLDSPLNPADVVAAVEMITVIIKSATALAGLATTILTIMRNYREYRLAIQDPETGKVRGVISHETPEKKVRELLQG